MKSLRLLLIAAFAIVCGPTLADDPEHADTIETLDMPRAERVAAPPRTAQPAPPAGQLEDEEHRDTLETIDSPARIDNLAASKDGPMPAIDATAAQADPGEWIRPAPRTLEAFNDGVAVDVEIAPPVWREEIEALTTDPGFQIADGRVDEIDLKMSQRGTWIELEDGGRVWTIAIVDQNAEWMRFHIEPFNPPPGAELILFNAETPEQSYGPYTASAALHGAFWTPAIHGSEARIELYVPAGVNIDNPDEVLRITAIVHGFNMGAAAKNDDDGGGGDNPNPTACRLDVTCDANWNSEKQGVARISFVSGGSSFICTGSMVNRLGGDLARIFLTAAHCINTESEANSLLCYWFYQTDTCNGTPPTLGSVPQTSGATLLATKSVTDVTIVGLTDDIPGGLLWEGWDTNAIAFGEPGVLIHHPAGVRKSISYGFFEGRDDGHCGAGDDQYRLDLWDGGQEGGSSGCPGFDAAHRVRTVATCSSASGCDPGENTWEGSLPDSWSTLSPFLDPQSTVWVDIGYGGTERGTSTQPWDTIIEGYFGVVSGGTINIDAGTYPVQTIRGYKRNMLLRGVNGIVLIGN